MEILIFFAVPVGTIIVVALAIAVSMALYRYYWDIKYDIIRNKYYLKKDYNYDDDGKERHD